MPAPAPNAVARPEPILPALASSALAVAKSCEPLMASEDVAPTAPSATPVTWRLPTPTTEVAEKVLAAINLPPISVPAQPAFAAPAAEPEPKATEPATVALAPLPMAMLSVCAAEAWGPMAVESVPSALASASFELVRKYLTPPPPLTLPSRAAKALPTSL